MPDGIPPRRQGFTLVELVVVIAVLVVLLGALYAVYLNGREAARRAADAGRASAEAGLAAERISAALGRAGYAASRPGAGRHPFACAGPSQVSFLDDTEEPGHSGPEDRISISSPPGGGITVEDAAGTVLFEAPASTSISFEYLDDSGRALDGAVLADEAGRDRIRTIRYSITAEAGEASFSLEGSVSPPNLGLR